MRRTLPVTEAREKLTELVDEVNNKFEQIEITKNGKPRAVIMSADEFDGWKETMEVLSDQQLMKDIKEAEKDFKEGRTITLEQLKTDLKL